MKDPGPTGPMPAAPWRETCDAISEALGVTVAVVDRSGRAVAPDAASCASCMRPATGARCLDVVGARAGQPATVVCASGVRCLVQPFGAVGRRLGWVLVGGAGAADADAASRLAAAHVSAVAEAAATSHRVLELIDLNELWRALNADSEVERIVCLASGVLARMVDADVCGVLLLRADERGRVVVRCEVTSGEFSAVLAEVLGEEPEAGLVDALHVVTESGGVVAGKRRRRRDIAVLSAPLLAADALEGRIFIARLATAVFTEEEQDLLEAHAEEVSVALGRAIRYARTRSRLEKTVAALSATLDATERTGRGHADRVMDYALAMGEAMGVSIEELEVLRFSGLLHDVGKVGVAEGIILKPARLTESEMAEVRRHAEIGATIVEQMEFLSEITPVVLHHHERWDGAGYPMGLAGEEIPLLARILAVADAYESMTRNRAYSRALPLGVAREELIRGAGAQFDPHVVAVFLELLDREAHAGATGLFAAGGHGARPFLA